MFPLLVCALFYGQAEAFFHYTGEMSDEKDDENEELSMAAYNAIEVRCHVVSRRRRHVLS